MNEEQRKAWYIWVNYCCMVKAWYTKDQPEPFGMNPPTGQIVDVTLAADAELTSLRARVAGLEGAVEWALNIPGYMNFKDELRRRAKEE